MTTFDVHMDKAMKELRARLDQAERERDEARASAIRVGEECDAALRSLGRTQTALDEERRVCTKALAERDEARAALGKIAAAARRVVAAEVAYERANDDAEMASRREPLPDELARRIDMTAEELLSAEREFRTELEAVL